VLAALACVGCLLLVALSPSVARAALTVESFSTSATNMTGSPERQAGAGMWVLHSSMSFGQSDGVGSVEEAILGLPRGLFLNPTAAPRCTPADFGAFECPPVTQVGLISARAETGGEPAALLGTAPVYALMPESGEIARLGVVLPTLEIPLEIPVTLRTNAGVGPTLTFEQLPEATPLKAVGLDLWGVPAASGLDHARFPAGSTADPAGCPGIEGTGCIAEPVPSLAPETPLLKNPTSCLGPVQSRLDAISHQGGVTVSVASAPGMTGCAKLGFSPRFAAAIASTETDTPTGLAFELQFTDQGVLNPQGIAQSAIKELELELPPGLAIGPGAFGASCGPAAFEAEPPTCPVASLVGTGLLDVAGFEAPLLGDVYLGSPEPAEPPRLLFALSGPRMSARLVADLQPGPEPEQVIVVLPDLPQLPIEQLRLEVAPTAGLLLTPLECGTYPLLGALVPWAAPDEELLIPDTFAIDSGPGGGQCPQPGEERKGQRKGGRSAPPQTPLAPLATPPAARPPVRITRKPARRTDDRTPTFRFTSDTPNATFTCKVDGRPFRACTSPRTLRRLSFGLHTFSVRAIDKAGGKSKPAEWKFTVEARRSTKHRL
jgi:hypothetical protein